MDRRVFLQVAGASGVAISGLSCSWLFKKPDAKAVFPVGIPTTCELCPNKCSVVAMVEGGRIRKLNPNPENPKSRDMLCARGNAAIQQVYDPDRLKQPLIRAGARGEGKWRPVSWEEAWDYTAKKLNEVKEKHVPRAPSGPAPKASRRCSSRTWALPSAARTSSGIPASAWPP